ncbi:MAG: 2-oxoglutarate dehydrogenase E1 component [Alphaproteobacteria bacterium]|nr:2-oxoglutarate dehydrogenase E1 component [Alphaproteobacteria bacterium]
MTSQNDNEVFEQSSFLFGANAAFIEKLHADYKANPNSVDASWRQFFASLGEAEKPAHQPAWQRPDWPPLANGELVSALDGNWTALESEIAVKLKQKNPDLPQQDVTASARDSIRAIMLIRAHRSRGHLLAKLDPLGLVQRTAHPELEPSTYGFGDADMDRPIYINNLLGLEFATVRQILEIVRNTYCGSIGVEYMHISNPEERLWIQERIEGADKEISFTREGKRAILRKLMEAELFEGFLAKKYTGTKRFGLDGGESLIAALEQIIKRGGALGVKEIVIGMPHRGRLNVLTSVMNKPYQEVFHEFSGGSSTPMDVQGSGDVKYHLGTSADREFDGNVVHLSLTANPSHLEAVNPVVLGKARAKQEILGNNRDAVLPLLMHGDAAFAGQGIVAECFGLSGLKGHRTGGTIHVIVNNQIGFTTAPHHSRSSPYPSDVAKGGQAPIFHANGDDPEAVVFVTRLATEYRQTFHKDVVVDMFCYRRHGHNEGDEPSFTQPLMYKIIRSHPTTLQLYSERLIAEGSITQDEFTAMADNFRAHLDAQFEAATGYKPNKADWLEGKWQGLNTAKGDVRRGDTPVQPSFLDTIGKAITSHPADLNVHRTIQRLLKAKADMFASGQGFDWATGEAMAFGSLMLEGYKVRLVGQDSARGTFSQRHSVLIDQESERRYIPLNHIKEGQARFEVIDSMLSEMAVLGFEYGYTLAEPNALVLWEAQFGDFANGAQVIIDQFIAGGESKWLRMSGLVMLLPHGYEGQGPEHSSARLERYLQLCAEDNIQVVNCTTPANYFHVLRRQLHRNFRKPLIIMTPKSLLRHKLAVSSKAEFTQGSSFHRILWDLAETSPGISLKLAADKEIERVILCSGKVYYDLFEEREKRGLDKVQILRIEQLYPFPSNALMREAGRFPKAKFIWCQEEPRNMGAWNFVDPQIEWVLGKINATNARPHYAGRSAMASTATGFGSRHAQETAAFMQRALTE